MVNERQRVQCHYEILGVETDADTATIKKNHRRLALRYHPDKNIGDDEAAKKFMLIQQAYEVLSDPQERKWYDDHRDAILHAGWTSSSENNNDVGDIMLFDVTAYMHPGCYNSSYRNNEKGGFYEVYSTVFESIVSCELNHQSEKTIDLPTRFGTSDSKWETVRAFYVCWESFSSALNFAWEDKYNSREDGENRRIRRLMDEENKKARRAAKKTYNSDVLQLVAFVKKRDPRIKAKLLEQETLKKQQEAKRREDNVERKKERQKAKEAWREASAREMEKTVEEDTIKGRIRLADLDDENYDYGGGKKKRKGKKKKGKKIPSTMEKDEKEEDMDTEQQNDNEKAEESIPVPVINMREEDLRGGPPTTHDEKDNNFYDCGEEEEDVIWRCECCRKNFKSEAQMKNHMKSKKHKAAYKKIEVKLKKREEELMAEMLEEMAV